jgi:hypothetical protein
MKAPDANDVLREQGPDALRVMADRAQIFTGEVPPAGRPLIQSSSQFVEGFVPPDYLVDGVLQRRFIYSFTARTGSGKTAIALTIAAHVGLGKPIGNLAVAKGRVLIFAGENPDDVRMRWIALAGQMGFDLNNIEVHFIPGTFKISSLIKRIRQEAEALGGVELVIVDTSAAFFEGDEENSNVQQGAHARRLRDLVTLPGGPCVIVNCHPVKNAADDNLIPRGGGAFVAEMDGNLTGLKEDTIVTLHWQGKFRGPDFAPITFILRTVPHERLKDSRGRLIPTVIASHLSEAGQEELAATARTNENRLLELLTRRTERQSLADMAKELGWFLRNDTPNKMKVKRRLEELAKHKLVEKDRDDWKITDKGRKSIR